MVFGRSIFIWLILLFLGYSILGTLTNLYRSLSGTVDFGTEFWATGLVSVSLSIWLFFELWRDGPRQVAAAWALFALFALMQVYAALIYSFPPDPELSPFAQRATVYIFTAIMVVTYAIIPLYLTWRSRKASRSIAR